MSGLPQPFEYNGVIDTLAGHCDRLDVEPKKYYEYLECHNLKDAPRASTFAVWAYGVLERRAIAIAKAKPVHTEFTCELCGKVKGLGAESIMMGKCTPCYVGVIRGQVA